MINWEFVYKITKRLFGLGRKNQEIPKLHEVEPFEHYFSKEGQLKHDELDEYDGRFSRREILTRYLLANIVLDQGPDVIGVRELKNVTLIRSRTYRL